jgi:hypothetical protein
MDCKHLHEQRYMSMFRVYQKQESSDPVLRYARSPAVLRKKIRQLAPLQNR